MNVAELGLGPAELAVTRARVLPLTVAFANIGRDKNKRTSTARVDRRALEALAAVLPPVRCAVVLAEINEGDDNNELALARAVFKGWRFYCTESREPIALSPDMARARDRVLWVPGTAVEHWSPRRSVNLVHLAGEPLTITTRHPAAGAHGQGSRPGWARPELNSSWDVTEATAERVSNRLYAAGRNQILVADLNDYDWGRGQPGQTVFHDRTDWGQVRPAAGYRPHFKELRSIRLGLDSHSGHLIRGGFQLAS